MNINEIIQSFFPLSSKYNKQWIKENSLGENVLYNLECLCEIMDFKSDMKILDLGCGRAISSIFLSKEFNVKVWAIDQNVSVTENFRRIKEMQCESSVFPLRLNARDLPFPKNFFDAIIVIDAYMYFGADDGFTPYITQFLKTNGSLGIVDICFDKEINNFNEVPEFLKEDYQDKWSSVHSLEWWKMLWEKSGMLNVKVAEIVPQNNYIRNEYIHDFNSTMKKDAIAEALIKDKKRLINIFRMVATKK